MIMVLRSTAAAASQSLPPPRPSAVHAKREDEFEFLCVLAGAKLSPERQDQIANWNLSTLDWNEFLRLAEHHGVLPLAARNLFKYRSAASRRGLPPEIERSLRSAYDTNLRRGLWFTAELARIMQHFDQRHLRAIPYKGPALAQSLYRDVALRSFSDLDFLISPADFERAKQALAEIGYHPSADLAPAIERLWLRIGYERSFDGAAGKNLVELQWALLPHFYAIDPRVNDLRVNGSRAPSLRVEDLLQRAGRTVIAGCEVPSLSPEDSLLVLCLHAAKHLWTRLIWLSDIAESLSINVAPGTAARQDPSPVLTSFFRDAPSLQECTHRLHSGILPSKRTGNHAHPRHKFLAREKCASPGPSRTDRQYDHCRSPSGLSRQRVRPASETWRALRFRIDQILPLDHETARTSR